MRKKAEAHDFRHGPLLFCGGPKAAGPFQSPLSRVITETSKAVRSVSRPSSTFR